MKKSGHHLVEEKIMLWDGKTGGGNEPGCPGCVGGRSGDNDGVGHEECLYLRRSTRVYKWHFLFLLLKTSQNSHLKASNTEIAPSKDV